MMLQHGLSITMLLLSAGLAATGLQQGYGWLDRVVQFQKNKLFNEVKELAPINMNGHKRKFAVELRPKSEGYEDSKHWDYGSVLRLLSLIRESKTAKPVHKALRRMLQPTRRIMMSMKQSMKRFPSLQKDDTNFYYDVDYTSVEDNDVSPVTGVPEDQAIIVVNNPVEARLPSARISVKLLREILEARSRAARKMPTSTVVIPWIEFVKNRTRTSTEPGTTDATGFTNTTETIASTNTTGGDTTSPGGETGGGESTTVAGTETGTAGTETGTAGTETETAGTETGTASTRPGESSHRI